MDLLHPATPIPVISALLTIDNHLRCIFSLTTKRFQLDYLSIGKYCTLGFYFFPFKKNVLLIYAS